MLIAFTGFKYFLLSERMQKIPRTIKFNSTPTFAASFNFIISDSSESEFILSVIAAGFPFLAFFISFSMCSYIFVLKISGLGITTVQAFRYSVPSLGVSRKLNILFISVIISLLLVSRQ